MLRRNKNQLGAVTLVAVVLTAVLGWGGVAHADTFTPGNSNPTVSTPTLPATVQPDAGASDAEYSYGITVGDADTLNDVDTVTVCLYLTTGGDSTCATPDPATDVKLTWTQSTNSFSIADGSANPYWALATVTPSSAPADLTAVSGAFAFRFTVSEAMRQGGWTAKVTATDGNGGTDATNSVATTTVSHYSAVTTRVQQSFGTIASGGNAVATASPTVTSNGTTVFKLSAGNFVAGTYSYTLKTDGLLSAGPAAGQVTFDCNIGSTFAEASAARVASTSTQVGTTQTSTGTAEGGAALSNTCRLAQGGQRPVSSYAATVVNSIAAG